VLPLSLEQTGQDLSLFGIGARIKLRLETPDVLARNELLHRSFPTE